jgi:hypothetical protein
VVLSAFVAGMLVTFAYLFTSGIIAPFKNINNSWATEGEISEQWTVTADTLVRKQNIYLCGDVEELKSSGQTKGLMGMSQGELLKMFASDDGWQVQFATPSELLLNRKINEFCSTHQGYRHLSISDGKMAIFRGPLGIDDQLIEVLNNRPIQQLPQQLQLKLQRASNYYTQSSDVQAQLQKELEFTSQTELMAVLENIDELN